MAQTQCFLWLLAFQFPGRAEALWYAELQISTEITRGLAAGQAPMRRTLPALAPFSRLTHRHSGSLVDTEGCPVWNPVTYWTDIQ